MKKTALIVLTVFSINGFAMSYEDFIDDIPMDSLKVSSSVQPMLSKVSIDFTFSSKSLKQVSHDIYKPHTKPLDMNARIIANAIKPMPSLNKTWH